MGSSLTSPSSDFSSHPFCVRARKWLESWYDPMAGLVVRDTCATSADIRGDNDWRLLAACKDRKMRVIVGSRQVVEREVALLENPTAVASFFSDEREPRLPAIAVAGGSHVFIYRNLRPFFKFKLPLLPVDEREQGAWSSAIAGDLPPLELRTTLARLRDDGVDLTLVSGTKPPLVYRCREFGSIDVAACCLGRMGPCVTRTSPTRVRTPRPTPSLPCRVTPFRSGVVGEGRGRLGD